MVKHTADKKETPNVTKIITNINNLTININKSPSKVNSTTVNRGKKGYYAVARGRKTGIYTDWFGRNGAKAQVDGYKNNLFKGFNNYDDAAAFLEDNM